ncbi:MAG: hypothetical protein HOY79_49360 [Streptomyces sp.]|nr:hypothetical protein [Streptomyces sp.]
MTETKPGADERRIQALLKQRGVGPDAIHPPPVPLKPSVPTPRPRDWLDDILDSPAPSKPAIKKSRTPADPDGADEGPEPESDEEEPDQDPPRWDPVAIADRIVHAYQRRAAGERLKHAAQVIVASRARWGQLLYTASGVWGAWRIGFTPWLLHETATAPTGIPVGALFLGWLVNRRLDGTPLLIAWCGRAVYTATVINLVLHP